MSTTHGFDSRQECLLHLNGRQECLPHHNAHAATAVRYTPSNMGSRIQVIEINPGVYSIGDDSIPDAGPRHLRHIDAPLWIEKDPVSVNDFAQFVWNGGFGRRELWMNEKAAGLPSVDLRCEQVCIASCTAPCPQAVMGLNWFEASAIARFAAARLPFEIEWEIVMSRCGEHARIEGGLLEWTADVFSRVYWRADYGRRGVLWSKGSAAQVSVRGWTADALIQHVCARQARDPQIVAPCCGFRRVWDTLPLESEVVSSVSGS